MDAAATPPPLPADWAATLGAAARRNPAAATWTLRALTAAADVELATLSAALPKLSKLVEALAPAPSNRAPPMPELEEEARGALCAALLRTLCDPPHAAGAAAVLPDERYCSSHYVSLRSDL
jgi:hypothetical protein